MTEPTDSTHDGYAALSGRGSAHGRGRRRLGLLDSALVSAAPAKPSRKEPLSPGRTIAGRYVVQRQIGQGGMGEVLEVEHVGLGRRFALKVLRLERWSDELVRRFNREARALARVTTPRVAQVTDFGVDESCGPYYVMELLDGETLEDRLEREGVVSPQEALTICAELCDALSAVHAAGIVHRDLKPSNVGLLASGVVGVKLLDFGLAASMDEQFLSRITQSQQILGSLPYMAPEQFNGADPHPCMDIYAVGICLFESVTGRLPFLAPSTAALIHQILSTPVPPLPVELAPGPVGPLLERFLAKDASDRFASAAEAAAALRQAVSALGGPVRRHPQTRVASAAPLPGATLASGPPPAAAMMPPTMEARSAGVGHMPTLMASGLSGSGQEAPTAESGTRLSEQGQAHVASQASWQPGPAHTPTTAPMAAAPASGSTLLKVLLTGVVGLFLALLAGGGVVAALSLTRDGSDDTPPPVTQPAPAVAVEPPPSVAPPEPGPAAPDATEAEPVEAPTEAEVARPVPAPDPVDVSPRREAPRRGGVGRRERSPREVTEPRVRTLPPSTAPRTPPSQPQRDPEWRGDRTISDW